MDVKRCIDCGNDACSNWRKVHLDCGVKATSGRYPWDCDNYIPMNKLKGEDKNE